MRIGNVIGLVRMFRAGIVESCAPTILLGYQQTESMADLVEFNSSQIMKECARLNDRIAQNVSSNLRETNDWIEVLTIFYFF